jgi:uncharacterized protein
MPEPQAMNADLVSQARALEAILRRSRTVQTVLERAAGLCLPNWYLGAGCIAQTVWNHLLGRALDADIQDLDLVYFDPDDLGADAENQRFEQTKALFADLPIQIDLNNQARVHLWYKDHFGYAIRPYSSVEEAIRSWPTTATSVGVRHDALGFSVYAPYGLSDLFGLVVKANKVQITEAIYLRKVARWKSCWPELQVVPW